jgi:NAD(P)H-hydrate epimerase
MQKLYTANQIKKIDKVANAKYFISPLALMENAATNVTNQIRNYFIEKNLFIKKIAIFCGTGNNGGDGLVVARQLSSDFELTVFLVGDIKNLTPETRTNFKIVNSLPKIKIQNIDEVEALKNISLNFDCIIDAMIGVGFTDKLRPLLANTVSKINNAKSLKIAIDIPTGLDSDTGLLKIERKQIKNIFKADLTVSILGAKIGMYDGMYNNFQPNTNNICGEIRIANLAIGGNIAERTCNNFLLEKNDIEHFIYERIPSTHKFDYGRIIIIAGSEGMSGAAALAANAAIKTGAGVVQLYSTKIHSFVYPEIIVESLSKTDEGTIHPENFDYLNSKCQKADSIIFGPGIGRNIETLLMIRKLIFENLDKKIVVDADALSILNPDDILNENVVLTPHFGEFTRLIDSENPQPRTVKAETEINKIKVIEQTAKKMNCTILLKGSTTIISNGKYCYWNAYGNAGMATAGSGDVLAGIIAAILVKPNVSYFSIEGSNNLQKKIIQKVAIASLIHSLAGDIYAENFDMETLSAPDLINNIKLAMKQKK